MKAKVDIISGFLGAGKTTLIKKLVMEEYKDEKVVVVENEIGKVNIDGAVLKNSGIIVQEITAGCICCSLNGDLIDSIKKVIEEFIPDRIIIEPTGVARLSEVLGNCKDKKYSDIIELNNVITVVDVKRLRLSISYSKEFIENQIRATKSVVLSKTAGTEDILIQESIDYIRKINSSINIVNLDWDNVSAKDILNAVNNKDSLIENNNIQAKVIGGKIYHSSTAAKLDTWEFETNKKFNRENIKDIFQIFINDIEYGNIIRGKGVLKDTENQWIKFDYVPCEVTFDEYNVEDKGRLCIIGINLNKSKILELFA